MHVIHARLPNMSSEVSGVRFNQVEKDHHVSDPVEWDVANQFAGIPGYEIVNLDPADGETAGEAKKKATADYKAGYRAGYEAAVADAAKRDAAAADDRAADAGAGGDAEKPPGGDAETQPEASAGAAGKVKK